MTVFHGHDVSKYGSKVSTHLRAYLLIKRHLIKNALSKNYTMCRGKLRTKTLISW